MLLGEELRGDARRMAGYVCGPCQQPSDPQHMGTATRPAKTVPAPWDAFADVDAFVDEVLSELSARLPHHTLPPDGSRIYHLVRSGGARSPCACRGAPDRW